MKSLPFFLFTLLVSTVGCFSPKVESGTIDLTSPLHVYSDQVGVEVSHTDATFAFKNITDSEQTLLLVSELYDANDRSVGMARRLVTNFPAQTDTEITLSLTPIFHPRLWSPQSPYLYEMHLDIWQAGRELKAQSIITYGFRSIQFESDSMVYNKIKVDPEFDICTSRNEENVKKYIQNPYTILTLTDSASITNNLLKRCDETGILCTIPCESDSILWDHPSVIAVHTQNIDDLEKKSQLADKKRKRFVLLLDESLSLEAVHQASKKVDALIFQTPRSLSKFSKKDDWIRPIFYIKTLSEETVTP